MRVLNPFRVSFLILLAATACLSAEEGTTWPALKASWAAEHLKLADEMLKAGCVGFADTQAGLAGQLAGAEDPGVKGYEEKRKKVKLPDKGWEEKDWKTYEAKRATLHRKEAQEAADLLKKDEQGAFKEIETWALRLDPDQAEIRKRRGEEKVSGLGWLPPDIAKNLQAGKVRCAGAWEKPDPAKYVSWDKHYEIPTEHFLLKTTILPEKARELAMTLEAEYRIWEEIFEGVAPIWGRSEPPVVWMLKTQADYLACVAAVDPNPRSLGMARTSPGFAGYQLAFFHEECPANVTPSPFGVAYHECSHLIHHGILKVSDIGDNNKGSWCREGMANLLEPLQTAKTPDWNGVSLTRTPRILSAGLSSLETLPRLFGMDSGTFHGAELNSSYARAYILAHFLMYGQGGAHRRDLLRCLLATVRGGYVDYDAYFKQMPQKELCALAKDYAMKALK